MAYIGYKLKAKKGDKMGTTESAERREIEVELRGKNYTIRELDMKAYGDMENFIKSRNVRIYRENSEGVDPELVEASVMKILRSTYTPEELGDEMSTPGCLEYVAYLALRHNPGVTRESVSEIADIDNIQEITTALQGIGGDDDPKDEAQEGDPENPPETEEINA